MVAQRNSPGSIASTLEKRKTSGISSDIHAVKLFDFLPGRRIEGDLLRSSLGFKNGYFRETTSAGLNYSDGGELFTSGFVRYALLSDRIFSSNVQAKIFLLSLRCVRADYDPIDQVLSVIRSADRNWFVEIPKRSEDNPKIAEIRSLRNAILNSITGRD
ncbi:hypothetical protein HN011_008241 [Eciton burchellii]|nr:hypothetical protein HN011_008241 [Eciton burchellii]